MRRCDHCSGRGRLPDPADHVGVGLLVVAQRLHLGDDAVDVVERHLFLHPRTRSASASSAWSSASPSQPSWRPQVATLNRTVKWNLLRGWRDS